MSMKNKTLARFSGKEDHALEKSVGLCECSYRKPAAIRHKFISVKELAPERTTFQCHRDKL